MSKKQRWIKSIIETANTQAVEMPFARGNRKKAAKRARAA